MNPLQLEQFAASLSRQPVLSVYLALETHDPFDRRSWALDLESALRPVRASLASVSHDEREAFAAAARHLERALLDVTAEAGGATWVAFATRAGIQQAGLVTMHLPTVAALGEGIRIAPYLRVLNEDTPVILAIGDAAHVDVWEYRDGAAARRERVHAHHGARDPSRMSARPRTGFHHGTHGAIARDDMPRRRREGTRRMFDQAASRAVDLAGPEGLIVTGGIAHIGVRLARLLGRRRRAPVEVIEGLDVHASAAQVADAARRIARRMRNERDLAAVDDLIVRDTPAGLGALGPSKTGSVLARGRVRTLFVSERYIAEHAVEAEDAIRSARTQHAGVVVVAREAAVALDEAGGMAARLRYRLRDAAAPRRLA